MKKLLSIVICLVCVFTAGEQFRVSAQKKHDLEKEMGNYRQYKNDPFANPKRKSKILKSSHPITMPPHELKKVREERKRIKKILTPDRVYLKSYKSLITRRKGGVFRLLPILNCNRKKVVRVDSKCVGYFPSYKTFSFRLSGFTARIYGDIWFKEEKLIVRGVMSLGLMADLGKKDFEAVSLTDGGIKFLADFIPEKEKAGIRKQFREISKGIEKDGFIYSNALPARVGNTYALRIIAYRLRQKGQVKFRRPPQRITTGNYKEFEKFWNIRMLRRDQRKDLIIVFKVLRKKEDGGITIVWKKLLKRKSPKITFNEGEEVRDFKD